MSGWSSSLQIPDRFVGHCNENKKMENFSWFNSLLVCIMQSASFAFWQSNKLLIKKNFLQWWVETAYFSFHWLMCSACGRHRSSDRNAFVVFARGVFNYDKSHADEKRNRKTFSHRFADKTKTNKFTPRRCVAGFSRFSLFLCIFIIIIIAMKCVHLRTCVPTCVMVKKI